MTIVTAQEWCALHQRLPPTLTDKVHPKFCTLPSKSKVINHNPKYFCPKIDQVLIFPAKSLIFRIGTVQFLEAADYFSTVVLILR